MGVMVLVVSTTIATTYQPCLVPRCRQMAGTRTGLVFVAGVVSMSARKQLRLGSVANQARVGDTG
jgi:hypothetical protein